MGAFYYLERPRRYWLFQFSPPSIGCSRGATGKRKKATSVVLVVAVHTYVVVGIVLLCGGCKLGLGLGYGEGLDLLSYP